VSEDRALEPSSEISHHCELLTVIAHYRTQPGRGDEVAAILSRHIPPSRAEAGCIVEDLEIARS
jgi:hypothetical protein